MIFKRAAWLVILAPLSALGEAPPEEHAICVQEIECRSASSAELDELRGGFEIGMRGGMLRLDIGITRAVAVNDQLVATSRLVMPQGLAVELAPQPGVAVSLSENALIVQNGPGNIAPPPAAFGPSAMPIVIQNTLDNQKLTAFTVIDASVNSLAVMNLLRMSDALGRATAGSGR